MRKFLVFVICILFALFLSGCDRELRYANFEFVQFPNRIVYIANVDTELDFSGATIRKVSRRDGDLSGEFSIVPGSSIAIEHTIDFTTPGVYEVAITRPNWPNYRLTFFIQVIDEETFNQLKSGEFGTEED